MSPSVPCASRVTIGIYGGKGFHTLLLVVVAKMGLYTRCLLALRNRLATQFLNQDDNKGNPGSSKHGPNERSQPCQSTPKGITELIFIISAPLRAEYEPGSVHFSTRYAALKEIVPLCEWPRAKALVFPVQDGVAQFLPD